jgi:DNA-binding transcriptional MocR family regulator
VTSALAAEVRDERLRLFYLYDEIVDSYGPQLRAHGLAVYCLLCRHANRDGGAFPSIRRLAELIGASKSAVFDALAILEQLGLIRVDRQRGEDGRKETNVYAILPPKNPEQDQVSARSTDRSPGGTEGLLGVSTSSALEAKKLPPLTPRTADSPAIDEFWALYPKRVKKLDTERIWRRQRFDRATFERIATHLARMRRSEQWTKNHGQFIPDPPTYLNQRRWEDEPVTLLRAAPGSMPPRPQSRTMTPEEQAAWRTRMLGERTDG